MATQERPAESELPAEANLVAAATSGDRVALERLLLAHYDELARRVAAGLPPRLQATQAVEDILQVTFLQAFRDIGGFVPRDGATFGDWLTQIAEHRLLDAIKAHDRAKRGGDRTRVEDAVGDESRVLLLLDWIADDERSPSSLVARDEAVQALHVALASLAADQREAIRLRHLEGKSLEETAAAMNRAPDAVRGLVHRGKEQLREALGRASRWLGGK